MGVLSFRYNVDGADGLGFAVEVGLALLGELHDALAEGEEGVVGTDGDVLTSAELGATLTDDDRAGASGLTSIELNPQIFGVTIA